jgi:shikimate dehydrogenase
VSAKRPPADAASGAVPSPSAEVRLGVLGWPVAHSRSPAMHNAALAAVGLVDWRYQRLPVPPRLFAETVRALGGSGFVGANVTIPHKQAALAVADEASAAARAIGAANTLSFAEDGTIAAENTDAPGLLLALAHDSIEAAQGVTSSPVAGRRALVLGAGGSARAAVWALLDAGASEVLVWNRTHARAVALAEDLGARAIQRVVSADILVNCTSVGLQRSATDTADPLSEVGLAHDQIGEYSYVIDLVYTDAPTSLLLAAKRAGARTLDGLEMLLAQGALSFELWTGRAAPIDVMRRAILA